MRVLVNGGGIGGLAAALSLAEREIEVELFEQAAEVRELGVGINLLPHAVKELAELGLLEQLDATGVRTRELIYCNQLGQRIWAEPRGLEAGYAWPQFSIHRGRLQGLLFRAVQERLGDHRIHLGHRLVDFEQDDQEVTARFIGTTGAALPTGMAIFWSVPTASIRRSGPSFIRMKARPDGMATCSGVGRSWRSRFSPAPQW